MPIAVGIDIGGTKLQAAVLRGTRVVGQARAQTPQHHADDVVEAIVAATREALAVAGVAAREVGAVGLGFPGRFDESTGQTLWAANLKMFQQPYPLGPRVSEGLGGAPVVLENDVRAALTGEHRLGNGRGQGQLLGVFLGTGVGGGVILDGRMRRGRGAAGEIGHMVVKDGGRQCGCGREGCLEAYAGRGRMEARARQLVKEGQKTVLFDIMKRKRRERVTSSVIGAALEAGDKLTRSLVDDAVWALGVGLASAQNLLDVKAVVIGGGLGDRLGQPFVDRVAAAMQPHLLQDGDAPLMLTAGLGDLSGAVGAALLAAGGRAASPR